MSLLFTAYFSEYGGPKTGLTPTITVYKVSDNSVVVNAQSMTEVGGGWYKYSYSGADDDEDYVATADGGSSQPTGERYAPCSSGVVGTIQDIKSTVDSIETDVTFIKDIEGGRWKIDRHAKQMVFYKSDNETEVARFDLYDINGAPDYDSIFDRQRSS